MVNHVHISALFFLITSLNTIIFLFFWRFLTGMLANTQVGKGMAFIYS